MKKLNFGCGNRYSKDWVNIDFNSETTDVISCNLLGILPFSNNSIDAIYSSHTLEHFSREEGEHVLSECYRILKPNGILRIAVPDLEYTCREYLRILDNSDKSNVDQQYEWIIIELLDQMVRTKPGGLMKQYWKTINETNNESAKEYVDSRMGFSFREQVTDERKKRSNFQKVLDMNATIFKKRFTYLYVNTVKKLFPNPLSDTIIDDTVIGEKHKWMYDRYSLKTIFERIGFTDAKLLDAYTSSIPNFSDEHFDTNADGTIYKPGSIYCEGIK